MSRNPTVPTAHEAPSPGEGEGRVLTIPNVISLLRLACIPLFWWLLIVQDRRAAAAYLLAGLGATDWVDGWIARRFKQVSALGKVLDPTADRLMLIVGIVALLVDGSLPVVVGALSIIRESLVALVSVVLGAMGVRRIDVTWWGKTGTFLLMFAFPLFLASHAGFWWENEAGLAAWAFVVPGLIISYVSACGYVPIARQALAERGIEQKQGS